MKNNKLALTGATLAITAALTGCGTAATQHTAPKINTTASKPIADKVSRSENRTALNPETLTEMKRAADKANQRGVTLTYHGEKPAAMKVKAGTTVAAVIAAAGKQLKTGDVVTPDKNSRITTEGVNITVKETAENIVSTTTTIAEPKAVATPDNTLPEGEKQIVSEGHPGVNTTTFKVKTVDGKEVSKTKISSKVTTTATPTKVAVGTKVTVKKTPTVKAATPVAVSTSAPAPVKTSVKKAASVSVSRKASNASTTSSATSTLTGAKTTSVAKPSPSSSPTPSKAASSSTVSTDTSSLDSSRTGMWDKIAACESTNNWQIVSANGIYHGGLQFDHQTWAAYGGLQYAYDANLATKAQQIDIANKLYAARGLQPWQCGWAANS